jgi:hypothetical protein
MLQMGLGTIHIRLGRGVDLDGLGERLQKGPNIIDVALAMFVRDVFAHIFKAATSQYR